MGLDEAGPGLANDVGHLKGWPSHRFWSRRERRAVSGVETDIVLIMRTMRTMRTMAGDVPKWTATHTEIMGWPVCSTVPRAKW
jgi:hypothetical protein